MIAAQHLIPVPFYEDTIVLVGQDEQPFVAMKPIVTNMGLDWATQYIKLSERFASTVGEIPMVAEDGKLRPMVCLPLRKLPAWLYSISPNKVKPELRDKIVRYQNECDDALWDYWSKGNAARASASGVTQQLAVSRHRLALLKELHRTRNSSLRAAIHQQVDHASRLLGLPTPELNSIGWSAPAEPEVLARFWAALADLDAKGVEYNHHRTPGLLAINLRGLARLLAEHGQPMLFDRTLRDALALSQEPRCLHVNHAVNSYLAGKSVRCWVFEKPQPREAKA
ncbi:phage antirepressor N-terminal domain-containing protein [Pseudomonas sp. MT3]